MLYFIINNFFFRLINWSLIRFLQQISFSHNKTFFLAQESSSKIEFFGQYFIIYDKINRQKNIIIHQKNIFPLKNGCKFGQTICDT